jgi:hypothetical protein
MTAAHILTSDDHARLTGQTLVIVERLRRGPATNAELAASSLKYTSRVSDARAAGYVIDCERLSGGTTLYRLVREPGQPLQLALVMT